MINGSKKCLHLKCKGCKKVLVIPEYVFETPSCEKCGGTQFDLIRTEEEVIKK